MFYFAYGSNLHKAGMGERCRAAVPIGLAMLPDHRRVFRRWADIEPAAGSTVAGGLWRITPECLLVLDDYEEVETALYRRLVLDVKIEGGSVEALLYRMISTAYAPPEPDYLAMILDGCRDFGVDESAVLAAVGACSA